MVEAAIGEAVVGTAVIVHSREQILVINGEAEAIGLEEAIIMTATVVALEEIEAVADIMTAAVIANEENQKAGMMIPFPGACSAQRSSQRRG